MADDRSVKSGLTTGPDNTPMFAPELSFAEQLAAQAAKTKPVAEATPETRSNPETDSADAIVAQLGINPRTATLAPDPESRSVQDGLTVEEPAEQRDRYGHTAAEAAEIHAEYERALPEIERSSQQRQLAELRGAALEAYTDATENGDYEELIAAATNLRAVDPKMWMNVVKAEHESELDDRAEYDLEYGGSDDEFASEHERTMAGRTSAQELAEEVEVSYLTAKSLLEASKSAEGREQVLVDFYGDDFLEGLQGFVALQKALAAEPELLDSSTGSQMIREALAVPVDQQSPEQLHESLKLAHGLADDFRAVRAHELRETAKANFYDSVTSAPSTDVSAGLTTADTEMAAAVREQNRIMREDDPAPPISGDRAYARSQGWSEPVRRRESAAEIQAQVAAPSERSVSGGLTEGGRKVSVDDAIARGQGFASAKERVQEEERAARARDLGITR